MVSQPFSFYGQNTEDIENLFAALTFLELAEEFKRSEHYSGPSPRDHYHGKVIPKFKVHLRERFDGFKSVLAKEDHNQYDGKAIVHAIKLCRSVCADLKCADVVYRSAAGAMKTTSSFFYKVSCQQYDELVTLHTKEVLAHWNDEGSKSHDLVTIVFELYFELDRLLDQGFKGLIKPEVVGDRVLVKGFHPAGTVRFVGKHHDNGSEQLGVELDEAIGDHNGTIAGQQYFKCDAKRGLLVRPNVVKALTSVSRCIPRSLCGHQYILIAHHAATLSVRKIHHAPSSTEMEAPDQAALLLLLVRDAHCALDCQEQDQRRAMDHSLD